MTFYKWKISWLNIISILMIMIAGIIWFDSPRPTLILADEADTSTNDTHDEETISWDEFQYCTDKILPMIQEKETELTEQISEIFLRDEWNSVLLGEVNTLIREAFAEIYAEKERIIAEDPKPDGYTIQNLSEEAVNCENFIAMRERTVWAIAESHNIETAGSKSSYVLVRKLKDINDGLREMNIGFGQIYAGFKKFADKLPGVTK